MRKTQMNDKIKELLEQAGVKYVTMPKDTVYEKFAELIVRECAQRIDYWESRQGEHTDDLLKHFGVEE
jgi:hypothetical protein